MKNVKRMMAFVLTLVMVLTLAPANNSTVTYAKKATAAGKVAKTKSKTKLKLKANMVVTDKNVKYLNKILASSKVQKITLKLTNTKEVTIPGGDHSDKKLVVKSPNTKVTNKSTFDTISLVQIPAENGFTEKGKANSIHIDSKEASGVVIDTKSGVAGVYVGAKAGENNVVDVKGGKVSNIVVGTQNPVAIQTSGQGIVRTVAVQQPGAQVDIVATDSSRINNVKMSESAGVKSTTVNIVAEEKATIKKVTSNALGATINAAANDEAKIGTIKINGNANLTVSGDSKEEVKLDLSDSTSSTKVEVSNESVKVEKKEDQTLDGVIDNKTDKPVAVEDKKDTTPKNDTAGGGDKKETTGGGGGGGNYSGGGNGGAGANYQIQTEAGNLIRNGKFPNPGAWTDEGKTTAGDGNTMSIGNGEAKFVINNVGTVSWYAALNQGGIKLEKNTKYTLKFKASSTVARKISVALQDATGDNWYGGTDPELTTEEKEFTATIDMGDKENKNSYIQFGLGMYLTWEGGTSTQHPEVSPASTIVIKDVRLTKVEPQQPGGSTGDITSTFDGGKIQNGDFSSGKSYWSDDNQDGGTITISSTNKQAVATVNTQTFGNGNAWKVQLQQAGVSLYKDCKYELSFKASLSGVSREASVQFYNTTDGVVGGNAFELTNDGVATTKKFTIDMTGQATIKSIALQFNFGFDATTTGDSVFTITDVCLKKTDGTEVEPESGSGSTGGNSGNTPEVNLLESWGTSDGVVNGVKTITVDGTEGQYNKMFQITGIALEDWATYTMSFDIESSAGRTVTASLQAGEDRNYCNYAGDDIELEANVKKSVTYDISVDGSINENKEVKKGADNLSFQIPLGKYRNNENIAGTVKVSNVKLVKTGTVTHTADHMPEVIRISNLTMVKKNEDGSLGNENLFDGLSASDVKNYEGGDQSSIAFSSTEGGSVDSFRIALINRGTDNWHVQLIKDVTDKVEVGKTYRISYNISSEDGGKIDTKVQNTNGYHDLSSGGGTKTLSGASQRVEIDFTVASKGAGDDVRFEINMGKIA